MLQPRRDRYRFCNAGCKKGNNTSRSTIIQIDYTSALSPLVYIPACVKCKRIFRLDTD